MKRLLLTLVATLATLIAGAASATCTSYPYTLTNGTTADATQVMANFNCAALLGGANFTGNVGVGTTTPLSALSVSGGVAIGSSYAGTTAAPTNGLIVQGISGFGTSNPTAGVVQIQMPLTGTGLALSGTFTNGTTRNSALFSAASPVSFTPTTAPTLVQAAVDGVVFFNGTVGMNGGKVLAENWDVRLNGSGTFHNDGNYNPDVVAAAYLARTLSPFSGTINGEMVGAEFSVSHTAGSGTVGLMAGVEVNTPGYTTGGTVNGPVYGARIANQGNAAWATSYGLSIDAQSGSTSNNYAVYSAGGTNYFGGNVGVGTSSPGYAVDVVGEIRASQAVLTSSAAPTISTCGTSPPAATSGSNNNSGQFTLGTGSTAACTVTFANAFPTAAFCTLTPASAYTGTYYISAQSASAFTVTLATAAPSAKFNYTCGGN